MGRDCDILRTKKISPTHLENFAVYKNQADVGSRRAPSTDGKRLCGDIAQDEILLTPLSTTGPALYLPPVFQHHPPGHAQGFVRPLPFPTSPHQAQRPLLFTLSTNTPNRLSHATSHRALLPLHPAASSCLSTVVHPVAPIACSLAFFHKRDATPFWSDRTRR